jgi:acyl CoA:acetate/3-ketoacid CoA transferase beta subunit
MTWQWAEPLYRHGARHQYGEFKIVRRCDYPLTAKGVVKKIFTNLAVIEVTPRGLVLREVAPGLTAEDVQSVTEPELIIAPDLKEMAL